MTPCRARSRRRGAALVVALVALAIAGAVGASMVKIAVLRREHRQQIERGAQARWLLHSGVQRATARIAADPRYEGETWQPLARGTVSIRVEKNNVQPSRRRMSVSARYEQSGKAASRSRQLVVDVPEAGDQT